LRRNRSHLDRHHAGKPAAPVVSLDGLCAAGALRRIALHHTPFAKATCGIIRLQLLDIGALVGASLRGGAGGPHSHAAGKCPRRPQ